MVSEFRSKPQPVHPTAEHKDFQVHAPELHKTITIENDRILCHRARFNSIWVAETTPRTPPIPVMPYSSDAVKPFGAGRTAGHVPCSLPMLPGLRAGAGAGAPSAVGGCRPCLPPRRRARPWPSAVIAATLGRILNPKP
jgi:hypothetical protein